MTGVFSGFFIVWAIIIAGYLVGRRGVLGPHGQEILSKFSFYVASPPLLFLTISEADIARMFSAPLLVAAVSALLTTLAYAGLARWLLRRDLATTVMGAQAASQVNSANLGIPIATFVLGDATQVVPVLLFQLAINTPVYLTVMDTLTDGRRPSLGSVLHNVVTNPMIVGSALGILFAVTGWQLPEVVEQPVRLVSGASIPAMLMAFGISLVGASPLRRGAGPRRDVALAAAFKLLLHPLLAFVFARFLLGLDGHLLYAVVVMAALPTAQNIYVAAVRYGRAEVLCRDTVLVTTVVAMLTMAGVALVLS
ncbi:MULTISPECIES: AEC family transporter [Kocuria]|uniref:AEC family transporter n=1 Tax=Kocuria TaxID=57493 RepID=UPI00203C7511|nr:MULTISPECIES: AEC family transporter [Kocuria]MCM3686424.1 AEC family transporter [Kocuria rosea]HST71445.1 AEC family transporter [Kocuria rosea]